VGTAIDDLQWTALLLAISGFEAYQRENHVIDVEKVVGFFLFNRKFPRSVRHCVASAGWSLGEIDAISREEMSQPMANGRLIDATGFMQPLSQPYQSATAPVPLADDSPDEAQIDAPAMPPGNWDADQTHSDRAFDRVTELRHRLAHTTVREALAGGMHEFVDSLQTDLNRIGDAVAKDYFQTDITS
ncbi:MAG: alpha-E domain-containing protein, partial [Planctomycetota bacterium]